MTSFANLVEDLLQPGLDNTAPLQVFSKLRVGSFFKEGFFGGSGVGPAHEKKVPGAAR